MNQQYIYIGRNLNLKDFRFIKGTVYIGEKVEAKLLEYPLLNRVLVKVEELPQIEKNETLLDAVVNDLEKQGGNN